ncbi:hypothetical protein GCM10010431_80850 [Streptomyces kunmingensis]
MITAVLAGQPPEDVMTTTSVRTPHADVLRDRDVMSERITVQPRKQGVGLRREDACRVGAMRRIAAARLRHCGLEALSDEVTLVVSELVTNALLHSGTAEVGVTMAIQDGFLTITVTDGMSGAAVPGLADGDAESGRGLDIVEYVVKEHGGAWGTCEAGAETWCRFALPEEASR